MGSCTGKNLLIGSSSCKMELLIGKKILIGSCTCKMELLIGLCTGKGVIDRFLHLQCHCNLMLYCVIACI